jgi:transcription initiation factor TFIIIB Brf1 subunit/transcription initiation factor TFIIB
MNAAKPSAVERLACPQCDGVAMIVEIEEGGSLRIVCAGCGDVVAYTSDLVRVTFASKRK